MKKMNETPFNFLYYDTWSDYYDNPTFTIDIDVKEIINKTDIIKIYYRGTILFTANYIGFKFTPDYDLENVNVNITIYGKSDKEKEDEIKNGVLTFLYAIIFAAIIVPIIIIIIIVVVIAVIVALCTKKRPPPPQLNNNYPYQQQNLPQQPQYYSPPQPQYHPPQPEIIVQPQNPPIQASIQ